MQNQDTTSNRLSLTDKELHYMKDYLSWELLAMKKYHHNASLCVDTNIKSKLNELGLKHKQHYETILNQLQ